MIARSGYQQKIWRHLLRGEHIVLPDMPRYRNSILGVLARARKAGYVTERTSTPEGQTMIRLRFRPQGVCRQR